MNVDKSALDVGLAIARELEARALPYALGGALALGVHGVPRGTLDVDINVFVPLDGLAPVTEALQAVGVEVDLSRAVRAAEQEGMFIAHLGPMRIDVFVPSIDFSWEAQRTRVQRRIGNEPTWFLSAEALAVFKMLFFRGKDLIDLERLLPLLGDELDQAYVRRWLVIMMGEDDERIRAWDGLVARAGNIRS